MNTIHVIVLFAAMFLKVFLMGFQSKNVVGNHYRAAFLTSVFMGTSDVILITEVATSGWLSVIPVTLGGSFGIVSSMWTHNKLFKPPRVV